MGQRARQDNLCTFELILAMSKTDEKIGSEKMLLLENKYCQFYDPRLVCEMKLHLILHFTRKSAMPVGPRLQVKNQNPFCVDTSQASPNNHFCDTFNFFENFIVQFDFKCILKAYSSMG